MHRVVVVDDYEPSLAMYSAVIEKLLNGQVATFSDPREALRYISSTQPTLVVVDFNMPDMDGVALVEEMHALPGRSRTPVIMLTGADDREVRTRALKAGVNAFLIKPVGAEEFAAHVQRLSNLQTERLVLADEMQHLRGRAEGADRRVHSRDKDAILALFRAYEARDADSARRMKLAGEIIVLLAIDLRASSRDVQLLRDCAFVYDIGKLSIPEKLLATPSGLSPQSRAIIEAHCESGAAILHLGESKLFGLARVLARQHHERYDGDGYPNRLSREEITLAGRMAGVADGLVAMVHTRADRPAMPFGRALDQIRRESGTRYDPSVVAALERIQNPVAALLSP
jgi:response regulator RpfG family c-di-GMP phosphodiesterase